MYEYITNSEQETVDLAKTFAVRQPLPRFVCLDGELGTGKTVFVKGFAEGLGLVGRKIKSPTYTYVREYKIEGKNLFHFDFYRIESLDELMEHDLRELFGRKRSIFIVEWAERIRELIPCDAIKIRMEYIGEKKRKISIYD